MFHSTPVAVAAVRLKRADPLCDACISAPLLIFAVANRISALGFPTGATRGANAAAASGTPQAIDVTHEVFAQQFSIIKANYECKVILMFVHDGVRPCAVCRSFVNFSWRRCSCFAIKDCRRPAYKGDETERTERGAGKHFPNCNFHN